MSTSAQVKEDYHKYAEDYEKFGAQPIGILESQLVKKAIGNASGLLFLDLGGGAGVHAREAIDAGASRIDLVDLTPDMLRVAEKVEKSLGREDRMRFYEADVSSSLGHLPLEQSYDVVMANWVFDHAGSLQMLEGMWQNVEKYLKPGGTFLGIRAANVKSPAFQIDKYGVSFKNFKPITGGVGYTVVIHENPPWEFEATSMEINLSSSFEMDKRYGLTEIQTIPFESAETIQSNLNFWKMFLESPPFVVVKAIKKP